LTADRLRGLVRDARRIKVETEFDSMCCAQTFNGRSIERCDEQ